MLALVGFVIVAFAVTGEGSGGATWVDRVLLVGSGAVVAYLLHRFASVRVEADHEGVRVVNLVHVRKLSWAQVVGVRLDAGDPWVMLDLADGETLAAMGIQGSDGDYGRDQARALAAAVVASNPE